MSTLNKDMNDDLVNPEGSLVSCLRYTKNLWHNDVTKISLNLSLEGDKTKMQLFMLP